jgi:hypothetical protein
MKMATDITPEEAQRLGLPAYFTSVPGAPFYLPSEAPQLPESMSASAPTEQAKPAQAPTAENGVIPAQPVPQPEAQNNPPQPAAQPAVPVDPALAAQERARFAAEEAQQVANQKIQGQNVAENIEDLKRIEADVERSRKEGVVDINNPTAPDQPPAAATATPAPQIPPTVDSVTAPQSQPTQGETVQQVPTEAALPEITQAVEARPETPQIPQETPKSNESQTAPASMEMLPPQAMPAVPPMELEESEPMLDEEITIPSGEAVNSVKDLERNRGLAQVLEATLGASL